MTETLVRLSTGPTVRTDLDLEDWVRVFTHSPETLSCSVRDDDSTWRPAIMRVKDVVLVSEA